MFQVPHGFEIGRGPRSLAIEVYARCSSTSYRAPPACIQQAELRRLINPVNDDRDGRAQVVPGGTR